MNVSWARRPFWRTPEGLLIVMAGAMAVAFHGWSALLNNFVVERAAFTGEEIGILQSLREVPGFLAFAAVFLLLVLREQTVALLALACLGIGTALTGLFPSALGLYATTVLMSLGFHYYETMQQSLTLQWVERARAPLVMGRQLAAVSVGALLTYGLIYGALELLGVDYVWIFAVAGVITLAVAIGCWVAFPQYTGPHHQHKRMIFRRRYWLYYALTFMSGARRQIFIVFAVFMLVERFGFSASTLTLLLLGNHLANIWLAPRVGRLIARWGERRALICEYVGLIGVFTTYAFVEAPWLAAALYVVDHLFFAFAISIKSYFQKIADPRDIASSAGVSFSINHIAAVVIPAVFGLIWVHSPSAVFLLGTGMAAVSLLLALRVPRHPGPGRETAKAEAQRVVGAAA